MKLQLTHSYEDIISMENLLGAWKQFLKGKRNKRDVQVFQYSLSDRVLDLHTQLVTKSYKHGAYEAFKISDPKPRDIHKSSVQDRLLHHAIYRKLYPVFNNLFIADSYSCRNEKGTHKAMNRFRAFAHKASRNNTCTVWVLKCDIRKFFASIDHDVLMAILRTRIPDENILWLIERVVKSFSSTQEGKGLPLGNLTSQLLVNIYMNEFDQYVKHTLKAKYYIRYADDFVLLSHDKKLLQETLSYMIVFLGDKLKLEMHPQKVFISTLASGVDFLGWVHFPDHRVLRTVTKKRMKRRIEEAGGEPEIVESYLGLLNHGNAHKLRQKLLLTYLF